MACGVTGPVQRAQLPGEPGLAQVSGPLRLQSSVPRQARRQKQEFDSYGLWYSFKRSLLLKLISFARASRYPVFRHMRFACKSSTAAGKQLIDAVLLLGRCRLRRCRRRRTRTCRRRRRRYSRRRNSRRRVVGIYHGLRDVGRARLRPKHRKAALLAGVIQQHGVAIVLHVLDHDRTKLLRNGTERLLQLGIEGSRGVVAVTLQLFLFRVDCSCPRGPSLRRSSSPAHSAVAWSTIQSRSAKPAAGSFAARTSFATPEALAGPRLSLQWPAHIQSRQSSPEQPAEQQHVRQPQ